MAADTPTARDAVARFRELADAEGVRRALRYLNGLTTHRFTAVFRFEGGTLRNIHLVDRDDPTVERCADQEVAESYCVYVRRTEETFITEASLSDRRVDGHPKQQTVQSYCGVPLLRDDGELFGTICHFDYEAIPFSEDEAILLELVAPHLLRAIDRTEWRPAPMAASR